MKVAWISEIGNWNYPEFLKIGDFWGLFLGGVWVFGLKSRVRG